MAPAVVNSPKPQRRERRQVAIWRAAGKQLSHHMRGDRRQQDPVTIVSRRCEIPWQRGWPEDGKIIGRTRTQPGPGLMEAHIGDRRCDIGGCVLQSLYRVGIDALVEAGLFHRGAKHDTSITARDNVHLGSANDVLDQRPRMMQSRRRHHADHLSLHRASRYAEEV